MEGRTHLHNTSGLGYATHRRGTVKKVNVETMTTLAAIGVQIVIGVTMWILTIVF